MAGRQPRQLYLATASGQVDEVRQLLDQGVPPDKYKDPYVSGLALCRVRCFAELWADFVLRSCGRVVRQYGWTTLMVAGGGGHTEIVRLLLEHGADVNPVGSVSAACVGPVQ